MLTHEEMIGLQREKHDLIEIDGFQSKEAYVLHLMHQKAYEQGVKLAGGKAVLDLGCNTGYGSFLLRQSARSVVGVDVSERAIAMARAKFGNAGIDFQVVDGSKLPFDDKSFDLVCSFQVLEHVVDYARYIGEIKRVLRPSGAVMLTTPNAMMRLEHGQKPWNPFHVKEFAPGELKSLLQDFFSDLSINGLFAEKVLYNIELDRVTRAKHRNSVRPPIEPKKGGIIQLCKNVAPSRAKTLLRFIEKRIALEILHRHFIKKYSTADFFYKDDDLENALDFLAICKSD